MGTEITMDLAVKLGETLGEPRHWKFGRHPVIVVSTDYRVVRASVDQRGKGCVSQRAKTTAFNHEIIHEVRMQNGMAQLRRVQIAHLPPDLAAHVALYKNVKNAPFLQQQLLQGNSDFEYAFIDATTVCRSHALLQQIITLKWSRFFPHTMYLPQRSEPRTIISMAE